MVRFDGELPAKMTYAGLPKTTKDDYRDRRTRSYTDFRERFALGPFRELHRSTDIAASLYASSVFWGSTTATP